MSYKQEGNSCGAWDLTRLQMIKRGKANTISENTFRAFGVSFTSQLSAGGHIQNASYTLTFTGLWIKEA